MAHEVECKKCKEKKPLIDFPLDKTRPTGRHPYCRICRVLEQRERNNKIFINKYTNSTRKCIRCQVIKPVINFKNTDTKNRIITVCNSCKQETLEKYKPIANELSLKAYHEKHKNHILPLAKKRREERKAILILHKGGKCERCFIELSDKYPTSIFDFHHKEGKEFNISELVNRKGKQEVVFKEIEKCVLLCSNCHRIVHSERE